MLNLGICNLLEGVIEGRYVRFFLSSRVGRLCRELSRLCLLNESLKKLVGDGVGLHEQPEDLVSKFKALVLGGLGSYDLRSSLAYVSRVLFGIKVVDRYGKVTDIRELIRAVRYGGTQDLIIIKEGGMCEWLCSYLPKLITDLSNQLRTLLGSESLISECRAYRGVSYAEAIKVIKDYIPEPGEEARAISRFLSRLREAIANLLPGIDEYLTYASVIKFTPMQVIKDYVSECFSAKGRELVRLVRDVLRPASPAVMDLSKCVMYSSIDEVPSKEILKNKYLITTYRRVIRKEVRVEGNYDIVGEEVINSPTYALINALTNEWVEFEEILYGTNAVAKLLRRFIEENLPREVLNDVRIRKLLDDVVRLGEIKVVSEPGKDRFREGDASLVMKASPLVTYGLLEASAGWDGVRFGNAVINRYAVRFRASKVATKLGLITEYLLSR